MLSLLNINNFKTIAIMLAIGIAIWFYKDYKFQISENIRQTENSSQLRKFDSLKYASQTYTKRELEEYLEYNRQDLKDFIKKNRISTRRIQQIITQSLKYKDTISRKINLQPVIDAIKQNRDIKVPVIDSTRCMIIKGFVIFKNDTLSLDITDRQFKNKSDVIKYWERNQWSFLGIKTRLFGRKTATVIIKDDCGRSETFVIDTRK